MASLKVLNFNGLWTNFILNVLQMNVLQMNDLIYRSVDLRMCFHLALGLLALLFFCLFPGSHTGSTNAQMQILYAILIGLYPLVFTDTDHRNQTRINLYDNAALLDSNADHK